MDYIMLTAGALGTILSTMAVIAGLRQARETERSFRVELIRGGRRIGGAAGGSSKGRTWWHLHSRDRPLRTPASVALQRSSLDERIEDASINLVKTRG